MSELTLHQHCRQGVPLTDVTVIDAHCHMGPWSNFNVPEGGTAASMVHAMDRLGFDACIVSPHIAIGPDYLEGNRQVMAAAEEFPGRIVPYVTINPNYPLPEIDAEIAHWHDQGRIQAFKIHPALHGTKATHSSYYPAYEYAEAHSLPVLSHSWEGDALGGVPILASLAEKYPHAAFIVGHSATSWGIMEDGAARTRELPNVYLDLTGSLLFRGLVERMVELAGADRILFGTDMPFIDPRPGFGRMLMSGLSDDDKRLILGLNARRLFRL